MRKFVATVLALIFVASMAFAVPASAAGTASESRIVKTDKGNVVFKNGLPDLQYTGFATDSDGSICYLENGEYSKKSGLTESSGEMYLLKGGKVRTDYTGLFGNKTGVYFLQNGEAQLSAGEHKIGGVTYSFNDQGVCTTKVIVSAKKVLDSVGWKLKNAFQWSASKIKYDRYVVPVDGSWSVDRYANYGFDHKVGNCYVMSCTFYEMARILGYDCHVMKGKVPYASGGYGPHSWNEVIQGGKTYVCDANYQYEKKKNGFMFHYKDKGTWVYSDIKRVN